VGGGLNRIRGLGVCGPQTGPIEIDTAQQRFIMGVEFQPGGAAGITRTAVHELAETHVALADLIGRDADKLHARLVDARSAAERFEILEAWLLERLARAKSTRSAAAHAIGLLERMNVAEVGRQMGLAPKRLIRAFRDEVGLTPKRFCRIRRFERLLEAIDGQCEIDWARVGTWHGYYDQAHLVHEFRGFSGYSPTEYLALRGPYSRHVPLAE
jgi:AraC-like DNA-binding protein